jgi:hypothetical protein
VLETIKVFSADSKDRIIINKNCVELYENSEELINKRDPTSEASCLTNKYDLKIQSNGHVYCVALYRSERYTVPKIFPPVHEDLLPKYHAVDPFRSQLSGLLLPIPYCWIAMKYHRNLSQYKLNKELRP